MDSELERILTEFFNDKCGYSDFIHERHNYEQYKLVDLLEWLREKK